MLIRYIGNTHIWLIVIQWLFLSGSMAAQNRVIDFEGKRWDVSSADVEITRYLGREALLINSGTLLLQDVEFQDGTIEVDIAPTLHRVFAGIVFRAQSSENLEEVYLRLHKSGLPDALQYTPRFNGVAGWQLYSGEGFTAVVDFPQTGWIHLKIRVEGDMAKVYTGDKTVPVLSARLVREAESGRIGLWGLFGAYISNVRYTRDESAKESASIDAGSPQDFLTDWDISQIHAAESVNTEVYPSNEHLRSMRWNRIESEPTGLINISRFRSFKDAGGEAVVFAKTVISSKKDQLKELSFGYSDEISIFLNGRLQFSGNSRFRSRDPLFNGIVGLNDHLYLDLKKGDNELLFVITEGFGGWGYMVRLRDF